MYVSCSIQWNVLSYWETVLCFVRRTLCSKLLFPVRRRKKKSSTWSNWNGRLWNVPCGSVKEM